MRSPPILPEKVQETKKSKDSLAEVEVEIAEVLEIMAPPCPLLPDAAFINR